MSKGGAAAAVNRAILSSRSSSESVRNKILAYLYDRATRRENDRFVSIPTIRRELALDLDSDRLRIILDDIEFRGFAVGRNQPSKGKVLYQITPRGLDFIEKHPEALDGVGWSGSDFQGDWSDEKRSRVISEIRQVEATLENLGLSNEQVSQVRSYVAAAIAIADSPNPDADLIWEMLTRAGAITGIIGLFLSALSLLK
jgi:hypothetical protein